MPLCFCDMFPFYLSLTLLFTYGVIFYETPLLFYLSYFQIMGSIFIFTLIFYMNLNWCGIVLIGTFCFTLIFSLSFNWRGLVLIGIFSFTFIFSLELNGNGIFLLGIFFFNFIFSIDLSWYCFILLIFIYLLIKDLYSSSSLTFMIMKFYSTPLDIIISLCTLWIAMGNTRTISCSCSLSFSSFTFFFSFSTLHSNSFSSNSLCEVSSS